MAELEKLGSKFRVAQRIAKDPRFERLPCTHKGTYADDCLVNRVTQVGRKTMLFDVSVSSRAFWDSYIDYQGYIY